jgi:hypothetical protein
MFDAEPKAARATLKQFATLQREGCDRIAEQDGDLNHWVPERRTLPLPRMKIVFELTMDMRKLGGGAAEARVRPSNSIRKDDLWGPFLFDPGAAGDSPDSFRFSQQA